MNIYSDGNNVVLDGVVDFIIEDILECGQCFNFNQIEKNDYELVAFGRYLHVKQTDNRVILFDTDMSDYENIWKKYFDMDKDYGDIKRNIIDADGRLVHAVEEKSGIRILNQEFFETLISFIISQNNNIPRIKKIIHTISERFGEKIILADGREVYSFPNLEKLHKVSEEELRDCRVGFRASYIVDAVEKVYSGAIREEEFRSMGAGDARKKLMSIRGVGEKVANCVILFGLGFTDAFPVDVWMKRIMEHLYFEGETKNDVIEKYAYEKYGKYAGYAQQYLFFYGKEIGLGK